MVLKMYILSLKRKIFYEFFIFIYLFIYFFTEEIAFKHFLFTNISKFRDFLKLRSENNPCTESAIQLSF